MKKMKWFLLVALFSVSVGVSYGGDEGLPLLVEPQYPETGKEEGVITIAQGWNLIAIPVIPDEPYTVARFVSAVQEEGYDIKQRTFWKVFEVAVYKDGRFKRIRNLTYNMVPGEAYFVYVRYIRDIRSLKDPDPAPDILPPGRLVRTIYIPGMVPDVPVTLNLNRGWNGASLLSKEVDSLSRFREDLVRQKVQAAKIAFWRAESQEWRVADLVDEPDTIIIGGIFDPPVVGVSIPRNEGFFLLLPKENGLYIPGLGSPGFPSLPDGPREEIREAIKDLYGRFGIGVSEITDYRYEFKDAVSTRDDPPSISTKDYPPSTTHERGLVGLAVSGGMTYLYETSKSIYLPPEVRPRHIEVSVTFLGERRTEYDEKGNLILEPYIAR